MLFPSLTSILHAIFNLFGILATAEYDAIMVGAGAGGCPLAQTLIEGGRGLKVLLVERGRERSPVSENIAPRPRTRFWKSRAPSRLFREMECGGLRG